MIIMIVLCDLVDKDCHNVFATFAICISTGTAKISRTSVPSIRASHLVR